ncbi:MAG: transposase [Candidatus Nomurabacteria bacterium]|nr:transposase [Candidatus Nomurabacteria bacterium]
MPGKYYPPELKKEIIDKIKTEGITAVEAAKRYGIDVNNIYRWVSSGIAGVKGNLFEINRLKRENRQLKQIIGEIMFEKERGKKD